MGSIDIVCETYVLSYFSDILLEGKLQKLFHVFPYLKLHHNYKILYDKNHLDIYKKVFLRLDWKEFYGELDEDIPPDDPKHM